MLVELLITYWFFVYFTCCWATLCTTSDY